MKYKNPIYLVAARRSPIGRFGGGLKGLRAVEIAQQVTAATLNASMIEATELVVAGQVLQAGAGMNPARQLSLAVGIRQEVPAFTVNVVCGSGLKAVAEVAAAIELGEISAGVAVGMESMSQAPFYSSSQRWGTKYGDTTLHDALVSDGLNDPTLLIPMGETAERIADTLAISSADQNSYAAESHRRAAAAKFESEIIPIKTREGLLERDEHIRPDTTAEKLAALKPSFRKDGTVTAGNSSGLNDGAAVLFLASESAAAQNNWKPLARIVGSTLSGCDPAMMGLGPVTAVKQLLREIGWTIPQVDTVELNEAFAAQALGCIRQLGLDPKKVNPRGGAIALGHPIGCSGARILVSLLHDLQEKNLRRGIATLCIGGGMGIALAVERETESGRAGVE